MTYHLPVLASHHNVHPHLASCHLLMEELNIWKGSKIRTFKNATSLLHLMTSRLAPSTMIVHPYAHLMAFKHTREVITVKNIKRILTSISLVTDLEMLEMQYFHMMGEEQYILNPVVLSRVMVLRVGCKMVVDVVTIPTLEGLFMEPGFIGWTDFADTDLEPDMLSLVLSLLLWSQCQSTLQEIEFHNVQLTALLPKFPVPRVTKSCLYWTAATPAASCEE